MRAKLREHWEGILAEEPGRRFAVARDRLREWEQGRLHRIVLSLSVACLLILAGALFGFLPLLPGFTLGVPGLILLIGRTRRGAAGMDRIEVWGRRWWKKMKRGRSSGR